ncbi:zinc-ribbon domain-containing protein [Roseibium sp.]|uniref:zinc-ribbon domain-containing protein n=1 Tax=Roseibium sp. TaxID=1936156 RepID=UPI003A974FEB
MKIKCPDCSTSYDIKPAILGTEGRSVKCARCGNRWFVAPKDAAAEEAPEPADAAAEDEANWAEDEAAEEAAGKDSSDGAEDETGDDATSAEPGGPDSRDTAGSDTPKASAASAPAPSGADGDDTDDDDKPVDIETLAKRPKIKVNPNKFKRNRLGAILNWIVRRNYRRVGGMALFAGAIAACAFILLLRDGIVRQAPDLASLFEAVGLDVNLRGLEFRDLRTFREIEAGKPVLVVEGSIRNINPENTPVPAVRLSIRGGDLQEIYAWTVEPRTKVLKGLDETRFRTMLTEPPSDASDIQVRFIDRGQNQVILE